MFINNLVGQDFFHNNLQYSRLLGRIEVPFIVRSKSLNVSDIKANTDVNKLAPKEGPAELDHYETRYLWKFSDLKDQIIRWKEAGIISSQTKYYCVIAGNKFGGYRWHDWISLDMRDLELIGKMGSKLSTIIPAGDMTKEILDQFRAIAKNTVLDELGKLVK
jgi:hypothetical protein